jgi:hypothetical protein
MIRAVLAILDFTKSPFLPFVPGSASIPSMRPLGANIGDFSTLAGQFRRFRSILLDPAHAFEL